MRIGLLTTSFPRRPGDAAGNFVLEFARALSGRGHRVEVLAPEPREPYAELGVAGVGVEHVRYLWPRALERTFYGAGAPENLRRDPLAWLGALPFSLALGRRAAAADSCWDALVSHWALPCGLVAARLRARSPKPHLAVLHSADVHLLCRLPGRRRLARALALGADGLWFVSQSHRDRVLALLPPSEQNAVCDRAWVAPMGVELPTLDPEARVSARRSLGLTRFSLLALGRLVPIKGLDVLLRACAGRDWTLLIAGAGPEQARLARLAQSVGAQARFHGEVAGPDKALLLMAADALVVPSRVLRDGRSEGVPVAMLEAMAHGLPIVASAVGGVREFLAGDVQAGLLVPPDRPELLATALERVWRDAAFRSAAGAAARTIAERHTWQRAIEPALAVLTAEPRRLEFTPTP